VLLQQQLLHVLPSVRVRMRVYQDCIVDARHKKIIEVAGVGVVNANGQAAVYCVSPHVRNAARVRVGNVVVVILPGTVGSWNDLNIQAGAARPGGPPGSGTIAWLQVVAETQMSGTPDPWTTIDVKDFYVVKTR
jgi:hypothetical protein